MYEYQIGAPDRERLSLPEWVADCREALDNMSWKSLAELEKDLGGLKIAVILGEWDEKSAVGIAGYLWLCLKVAGDCPPWADFDIRTTAVKQKTVKPGPLAEASSSPSPETGE